MQHRFRSRSLHLSRLPIPIAGNRPVARNTQCKGDVCKANRVAVAQEERPVAIYTDRVDAVIVPITCDRLIPTNSIVDLDVRKAGHIRVLQIQRPVARSEHTPVVSNPSPFQSPAIPTSPGMPRLKIRSGLPVLLPLRR